MLPIFGRLPSVDPGLARGLGGAAGVVLVGLACCTPEEGVVGVIHPPSEGGAGAGSQQGAGVVEGGAGSGGPRGGSSGGDGSGGGGSAGATAVAGAAGGRGEDFETQFTDNAGIWTERVVLPGASVDFGLESSSASDERVAVLRFPGSDDAGPYDDAGPAYVTQIQTIRRFGFGTFRTRVEFGSCDSSEEVVSALLGYWGDSGDHNGNALTDELEIDWQVLCGSPALGYLTVFTDYEVDSQGNEVFRKLTRAIDFSSGDVYDTPSPSDDTLVLAGNDPALVQPDFPAPDTFYELGFEWHSDSLRFFIVLGGSERTAWLLTDPERIPQAPLVFMYNLWHPETHWQPAVGTADFPAHDVLFTVDWLRIQGE